MQCLSLQLCTVLAVFLCRAWASTYSVKDTYIGSSFYSGFSFQTMSDPTGGRVQYVSQSAAQSAGLVSTSSNSFVMRVDSTTTLSSSGSGRKSIRIQSNKQYTTHALVADIRHMPAGCSVWPALWEVGTDWPSHGEVDIIEGVNDMNPNLSSLHTSSGCSMSGSRNMKGDAISSNCDANANNNQGCGVAGVSSRDFGSAFNSAGGGWFVAERTNSRIAVWFWSRQDDSVPTEVRNGAGSINTANWGTPTALFTNSTTCNIANKFGPHRIVINTTLCGDWAGSSKVWSESGCSGSCVNLVNTKPSAFKQAYWDIAAIRVYT